MKVPEGKMLYSGGKKYKAGAEVSDEIAAKAGLDTKPVAPSQKKKDVNK